PPSPPKSLPEGAGPDPWSPSRERRSAFPHRPEERPPSCRTVPPTLREKGSLPRCCDRRGSSAPAPRGPPDLLPASLSFRPASPAHSPPSGWSDIPPRHPIKRSTPIPSERASFRDEGAASTGSEGSNWNGPL